MELGDLNKVWEIKALKKPGEEEARLMLERVAKQVQPIMRRRKWRVKLLSEFCPSNPALLGLNMGGGAEVKLRLRRPNRDWDFFPFDQVLDTMLHELCHIERGPHDAQFYKLWDELRKECEELLSKGITGTGEGFDRPGRRLGGFSRQPPLSSLRQSALAAAEKRARNGTLLPSGPKKLGGNNEIMSALSPIQAAAMAAERRMYDDLWCGSWSEEQPSTARRNRGVQDDDVVILGESGDESVHTEKRPRASSSENGPSSSFSVPHCGNHNLWECPTCTLLNQQLAPVCDACGTVQPKPAGSKYKTWACKFCTLENEASSEKCSACLQWKYSYGAPVSAHGPEFYGT